MRPAEGQRPAALVTGGARRLGKALALRLAREGYDVVLHYGRSAEEAAATREEILELGVACEALPHDLADAAGLGAFLLAVRDRFPRLSVLVNSASAYAAGTLAETSVEQFDGLFGVNLRAPFFLMQAFARGCESGSVVNVLDNKIGFNQNAYAAYALSKKALAELTRIAAVELAPAVRVNGVSPGVVLPAETRTESYLAWRREAIPLKRQGSPEHVADALMYLLRNDFVTGQVLTVDGGENVAHLGRNAAEFPGGEDQGAV